VFEKSPSVGEQENPKPPTDISEKKGLQRWLWEGGQIKKPCQWAARPHTGNVVSKRTAQNSDENGTVVGGTKR